MKARLQAVLHFVTASLISAGLVGCSKGSTPNQPPEVPSPSADRTLQTSARPVSDVRTMAERASHDIGSVVRTGVGRRGAPLVVFEETHTSRQGQIEQAIALVRLHDEFGMRDIALEGYLIERPAIDTSWFNRAGRDLSPTDRSAVAAQFLREGEISAAEFIKLTYEDVVVHPIETEAEHAVELKGDASTIALTYLIKIAQRSLRETHLPRIQELQREVESAAESKKATKAKEMLDFILSVDPWTKAKGAILADTDHQKLITAERMLAEVEAIDQRARSKGVDLDDKEKLAMNENLKFWRGRTAASSTMIIQTGRIADRSGLRLVALIIGAAHTEGMLGRLEREQRPYALVRTHALDRGMIATVGEIDVLDRKYRGLSVFSDGITADLLEAFPARLRKKPEPILNKPWFEAKSEIHLFISRITQRVIPAPAAGGPPNTPRPPTGSPPFGFSDDDLRGKWIYIDPKRIVAVPNENAVVFPIILNPEEPAKRKELWVKAGFSSALSSPVATEERKALEELLKKQLDEVRRDDEAVDERSRNADREKKVESGRKAEDANGRIQISKDIVATIRTTQESAMKATVGTI